MCLQCLVLLYAEAFVNVLSGALTLAILITSLSSWVPLRLPWGLGSFCYQVSEIVLRPIRRVLPPASGIDYSPLVGILAVQTVTYVVLRLLPPIV
ncbi:MAG: YggT family protein [Chloroflexi bacterium]|nr:YggT family protein [Chloroflexota bacterium]